MDKEAEVCYDGRIGRWRVDMYRYDHAAGEHVLDYEVGVFDTKREARSAAEAAARRDGAGVWLERRDGSLHKRYPP